MQVIHQYIGDVHSAYVIKISYLLLTTYYPLLFVNIRKEILKGFEDAEPEQGSGETKTTPSGLKITELLIGKGGNSPLPGYVIGLKVVVSIGEKVIYQTQTADG